LLLQVPAIPIEWTAVDRCILSLPGAAVHPTRAMAIP